MGSRLSLETGSERLEQHIKADRFAGTRVRMSAFVRSEEVTRWCGLFVAVEGSSQGIPFDNMASRPIRGTTDWSQHSVVLDFPNDATYIRFGCLALFNPNLERLHVGISLVRELGIDEITSVACGSATGRPPWLKTRDLQVQLLPRPLK